MNNESLDNTNQDLNIPTNTISPKKKILLKVALFLFILIIVIVFFYTFIVTPHEIQGESVSKPFRLGEIVLGEKVTYLFQSPKVGDRVIFKPKDYSQDYVGIILDINENRSYTVRSSEEGGNWEIIRSQIKEKIYFPLISPYVPQNNTIPLTETIKTNPKIDQIIVSPTTKNAIISSTPSPTIPSPRQIIVGGFSYEDTNDDRQYNEGEPKLANMQLYYYDSSNSKTKYSFFTGTNGVFSISLNVNGNLIISPSVYNNYTPRTGDQNFSYSQQNIMFGFRTSGALGENKGSIEGDIFHDSNKNGTRDIGENGIYFYKLYLVDSQGGIHNTVDNAQTTDSNGHFKYSALPAGTYRVRLSNPTGTYTIFNEETSVTLQSQDSVVNNLQIPVYKNN